MMSPDTREAIIAYNAAMVLFAFMFAAGKMLSAHMSIVEVVFYRNFLSFLPILLVILWQRDWLAFRVRQPRLLFVRCLLGTIGMGITFGAYALLPLATTTTILFTATLWLIPLSILFLGERVKKPRLIAALAGFVGVLIMARPHEGGAMLGLGLALTAAFFHAVISIILRQLGRTEQPLTIALSFLGLGSLFSAAVLPFSQTHALLSDIPLLLALGVCGAMGQYLLGLAYKKAEAQTLGPLNYLNLIWASILGYLIWGDIMDPLAWVGAAIIIGCNIYIVMNERRKTRPTVDA